MKKMMGILLSILMLVVPFLSVLAIEGNYYVYTVGDEVNFYTSPNDKDGTATTIISDPGASSQYVRVLATGYSTKVSPYAEDIDDTSNFKGTYAYTRLLENMNDVLGTGKTFDYAKNLEEDGNLQLLTLSELQTIFGATTTDGGNTYTIDASKWARTFETIDSEEGGIYTETVEDNQVWVVKFTYDNATDRNITAITVEKEPVNSSKAWELVPVIYLDKTYDCHDRSVSEKYACYVCNSEYRWLKVDSQDATCELQEDVTSKSYCAKNPKTGVENYMFEFLAVVGVCGIAIILIKNKNLFKKI